MLEISGTVPEVSIVTTRLGTGGQLCTSTEFATATKRVTS